MKVATRNLSLFIGPQFRDSFQELLQLFWTTLYQNLSIPWGIDLLVLLEDLAQIGRGYCVPRESRVVRLARNWGRIAGGLPLYSSEHPDLGIKSVHDNTIGRVAELIDGFDSHDRGTEHSEVFAWMGRNTEQIFAGLNQDLPDRRSSQPPEKAVVFYNAGFHRARTRGHRWQGKAPRDQFVVARTTGLPTHYFICFAKGSSSWQWFELSKEEARKWVLLVEKCAGTTNVVRAMLRWGRSPPPAARYASRCLDNCSARLLVSRSAHRRRLGTGGLIKRSPVSPHSI